MIAKDFAPIPGIRSFAIMRNLAVSLVFAIFKRAGEPLAVHH